MKKLIIYRFSKCYTCRKALKWLDQNGFEYKLLYIIKNPPLKEYLELALRQYFSEKKKIFNTRSNNFKSINFDLHTLSNEDIIQILQSDGKLIKRPFLVNGKEIIVGFNQKEYTNRFLKPDL